MDSAAAPVLRAIVTADIVRSSELRTSLGDDRADTLLRDFVHMVTAAITPVGGVTRRWMGDCFSATFHSASAAITGAIALQRAVAAYGRRADAVAQFSLRIGISVGEVVFDAADDEEHGLALVEAARLEQLAAPGEIVATHLVQLLGRRRARAEFEPMGEVNVKGLDEPLTVVRVIDTAATDAPRPLPGALALDRRFPLVGRAAEIATATTCWNDVIRGAAHTLLLAGQPGIGKSRLVAHLAEQAHNEHALLLVGVCDADLEVPYQPVAMALRDARALRPELDAAITNGEGLLGALFPTRRLSADEPTSGAAARGEIFEAVVDLLEALAVEQPVLLVLEDMHWAAAPTVHLLRHLLHRLDTSRVLVVATYRSEDITVHHPFNELVAETRTSPRASRLQLAPLGVADVVALIDARLEGLPVENAEPFARRVLEESAGNPFFVCELLHHLSATGDLARLIEHGGGDQLPIPDSVRDVVGQRLSRLAVGISELLTTASLIGHSFDLDLLAQVSGEPPDRLLAVLEEAERVALVNEVDVAQFSFAHAIVRATLLEAMSATRRALGHRRVAEAIEVLRPFQHDSLARHWQLGGETTRAIAHLALAAQRDLDAFAFESAAERFQAVVDHHRGTESTEHARAWLGLGLARRALLQPDYTDAVLEAGRRARRLQDADLLADAAIASTWSGSYAPPNSEIGWMVDLARDALAVLDSSDVRRARILTALAFHETNLPRREELLADAMQVAQRSGDSGLIGHVLIARYTGLWHPENFDARPILTAELARSARAAGNPELSFFVDFFAAFNAVERGDISLVRQHLAKLQAAFGATKNKYFEFLANRLGVAVDLLTGDATQADIDSLAERFASTHADTNNTWAVQTAILARQHGRFAPLVGPIRSVLEMEESNLRQRWLPGLGLALFHAGEVAEANEILDQFVEGEFDHFWLATMQSASELAIELNRVDRAATLYTRLLPYRDRVGIAGPGTVCYGLVGTTVGRLALVIGEVGSAIELLAGAVARADRMRAPYECVLARGALAEALVRIEPNSTRIDQLVDEALIVARQRGYAAEQQRLQSIVDASPARR